ncbi:MAG TPA: M24 family metallopeptidase [Candidatus Hydrogenedentes bacterium]|nr:M24 family metallopeptidase [Candidatus Hydrogenedentota bacterium]
MSGIDLFRTRIGLVQAFLRANKYDGILLNRIDNFAMATGGKRNWVWTAGEHGANSLFVTKNGEAYYVGNTIEEARVMDEELAGFNCGIKRFLWFEDSAASVVKKEFTGKLVSDDGSLGENVNGKLTMLRALLTPAELEKYRVLGKLASEAMTATLATIRAGSTEADIAATLVAEGFKRRCQVPVFLVAADERIAKYRHPIPTQRTLLGDGVQERAVRDYVMVVGCFLYEGIVVSITRFKQTGEMPLFVPDAYNRICAVDAIMQESSKPGSTLGDVFAACQRSYKELGFPENEWHNHHQGGATGYAGRTAKGAPGETFAILDGTWEKRVKDYADIITHFGMAFAWNPSAVGVKSEDTFILLPDGTQEIVSLTPSIPSVDLGAVLRRDTKVVKAGIAK